MQTPSTTAAALHSPAVGLSSASGHPNVFVRGLPLQWGKSEMTAVFGQFGVLTSLRLVRHSVTKRSLGYGFVRYARVSEAHAAISALDGTSALGLTLQVKFADADAGPSTLSAPSGLTPSDNCYVKHLPASHGVQEVQQLFETHGAVVDVKLFPYLDPFLGTSVLVRMASLKASERAISSLNKSVPPGAVQPLIVCFAESAAEKAARLSPREVESLQRMGGRPGGDGGSNDVMGGDPHLNGGMVGLGPDQLQQALSALSLGGEMGGMPQPAALRGQLPRWCAPLVPQSYQPRVLSSICIRGMPGNADRLWVFEKFSRYGAMAGLRILIDESTGLCNGTGFVHYADSSAAEHARQAMNGMRVGDKILHVMVQTKQDSQGNNGGMANGRQHSGGLDAAAASNSVSTTAGMLAPAAVQPVLTQQGNLRPWLPCCWGQHADPAA